jgi:hypothetical protein
LVYAFYFFNSIFNAFGYSNALFQKINGGIRVGVSELYSKIVIDIIHHSICLVAVFALPFFKFSEKRVHFVLLGGKGRGKEGEKKEEYFNVFFHK